MERKDFDKTSELKDFTKRCLHNESIYDYKGSIKIIEEYWKEAKTVKEFKEKVLGDERLSNNQGYWQLAKEDENVYNRLAREHLEKRADEYFLTLSDIGSLAVGTDEFRFNIPNLYGDTVNDVYIFNSKVNIEALKFLTTIEGEFNIYSSDCGKHIAVTLKGRYAIYRAERMFAFEKWND